MPLPQRVKIVEVGPRDGLQNEPAPVPVVARRSVTSPTSAAGACMDPSRPRKAGRAVSNVPARVSGGASTKP